MKPVVIQVFGNKQNKLEPEHHRIEFPGGHICVDRTTDGEYWAHVWLNVGDTNDYEIQESKRGAVVDSRVDYDYEGYLKSGIGKIEGAEHAQHIAVRVKLA